MSKVKKTTAETAPEGDFAMPNQNYKIIIAGVIVIALGMLLMVGGGSDDPNVFSDAIFSTRRLTVAPITILIGLGLVLVAIMRKPKTV